MKNLLIKKFNIEKRFYLQNPMSMSIFSNNKSLHSFHFGINKTRVFWKNALTSLQQKGFSEKRIPSYYNYNNEKTDLEPNKLSVLLDEQLKLTFEGKSSSSEVENFLNDLLQPGNFTTQDFLRTPNKEMLYTSWVGLIHAKGYVNKENFSNVIKSIINIGFLFNMSNPEYFQLIGNSLNNYIPSCSKYFNLLICLLDIHETFLISRVCLNFKQRLLALNKKELAETIGFDNIIYHKYFKAIDINNIYNELSFPEFLEWYYAYYIEIEGD